MGCIATLDYLNAAQSALIGIFLLWFGSSVMGQDAGIGGFIIFVGLLCLGIGVFMLILVSNYMALKRWAITTRIVLAVIGLLQFPAGTLINIYVLVVLSQAQSAGAAKRRMQASGGGRRKPRRRRR